MSICSGIHRLENDRRSVAD